MTTLEQLRQRRDEIAVRVYKLEWSDNEAEDAEAAAEEIESLRNEDEHVATAIAIELLDAERKAGG